MKPLKVASIEDDEDLNQLDRNQKLTIVDNSVQIDIIMKDQSVLTRLKHIDSQFDHKK